MKQFLTREDGATAIEYGLIASLILLVILVGLNSFIQATNDRYSTIDSAITGSR